MLHARGTPSSFLSYSRRSAAGDQPGIQVVVHTTALLGTDRHFLGAAKELTLFDVHECSPAGFLIVVELYLAVIVLDSLGFMNR